MKRRPMRSNPLLVAAALIGCLALAGCSDSDSDSTTDGGADQGITDTGSPDGPAADGPAADGPGADTAQSDTGSDGVEAFHLSCATLQMCNGCCPSEDQACEDACIDTLSEAAKTAWEELYDCATTDCKDCGSEQECTECVNTECSTQKAACNFGSQGSASCSATFECFRACPQMTMNGAGTAETCPTDPGLVCLQQCMQDATVTAADLAYAFGYCQYSECGTPCFTSGQEAECDTCLADKCTEAKAACDSDS